ncbi:MAG: hypothetical protein P4N60_01400 [Verrucomicrobiae bacterium]|nr:hypothetical protein [Verrucomicrobiae bacterium]
MLVTNGVYKTGVTAASRIAVQKLITVQSVNGPTTTIIQGQSSGSVRCAYLTNGATLSGFTLRNGYATGDGGGVYCLNANSILTNCIITGNSSKIEGGGGTRGSYFNCIINNNNAKQQGGGVYLGGTFNNCLIAGNSAAYGGGLQYPQALTNCTVAGNSATGGGGGGIAAGSGGPSAGIFRNCIVYYNVASSGGNNIMSASANSVSNCCTPDFYNKSCITNLPGMVDVRGGNYRL